VRAFEGIALLALAESALLALPLLPALDELRRKRDAKPLEVIQKHAGDIAYFARVFRGYIAPLQERLRECVDARTTGWGRLENGEEYVLLGDDRQPFVKAANLKGSTCPWLIAAGIDVTLPNDLSFVKEIYAAKSLTGGERDAFRAILCDQDIHLRTGSEMMRWAHAAGQLRADSDCRLYGRISSEREIVLAPGCTFQRLHASRIVMEQACAENCTAAGVAEPAKDSERKNPLTRRLVDGDLRVRPGEIVSENLVARGSLHIGARARMLGGVKGHKSVVLEESVEVSGSLISSGELLVGPRCKIGGPVLAEHHVHIASGSSCGTLHFPTTVSSPLVEVMEGTVFFGTVWARDIGWVAAQR
jgi:hypothetical protein